MMACGHILKNRPGPMRPPYFQPRLQIKGEGKGGVRKRAQYALPTFTTAVEAAKFLALVKRDNLLERVADENGLPPKQDKPHKPRSSSGALPRAAHCTLSTAHMLHMYMCRGSK